MDLVLLLDFFPETLHNETTLRSHSAGENIQCEQRTRARTQLLRQQARVVVFAWIIIKTRPHTQECAHLLHLFPAFCLFKYFFSKFILDLLLWKRPCGFRGVWPFSPGLPFAVNQEVVKQEEDAFLDIACRDFQEISMEQQLCADICQVGSLKKNNWKEIKKDWKRD